MFLNTLKHIKPYVYIGRFKMPLNVLKQFRVHGKEMVEIMRKYHKDSTPPWKWSTNDQLERLVMFPASVGGVCGSLWGANEGFKYSKHEIFVVNVGVTGSGVVWGYWLGFIGGVIWPVSTMVVIGRMLYPCNETDKKKAIW